MRTLTLAALATSAAICFGAASASAAPPAVTPVGKTLSQSSILMEPVQFGRRCWRWNRECRARWGWGWRYRRCMIRHGC